MSQITSLPMIASIYYLLAGKRLEGGKQNEPNIHYIDATEYHQI